MADGPSTTVGKFIVAAARRDRDGFSHWRAELNRDESAQELLYPLLYEGLRSMVEMHFHDLGSADRIDAFTGKERVPVWPAAPFPADTARRLMRAALGDDADISDILTADRVSTRIQVITYLAGDLSLTDDQLNWIVTTSEQW